MNKENIEQIKHELFHDYSWTSTKIDELDLLIEDVIEATEQQLILSGVSQQSVLLSCDNGCYWALKEADNKQYLQCSICERIEAT